MRSRGQAAVGPPAPCPGRTHRRALMNVNPLIASLETMSREGAELEEVLEAAVAGLHELNPRFHWTGIYELFPDGVLRLGPFVGAPTDHVFIGVGQGVCGTAVAEKRNQNKPDVRQTTKHRARNSATRLRPGVRIRSGDTAHRQTGLGSEG